MDANKEYLIRHIEQNLEQGDAVYVPSWQEEADIWKQLGVYRQISEIIDPQEGEVHIDLGSGLGHLLYEIKQRNLNTALIGIEARPGMVNSAFKHLAGNMVPVSTYIDTQIVMTQDATMRRIYEFDPEELNPKKVLTPSETIHLICDDIRQAQVLRAILSDTKINSGSFTFAGGFEGFVCLDPFIPIATGGAEEIMQRADAIQMTVRYKAMALLAEFVREGGRVVLAERFIDDDDIKPNDIARNIVASMGDLRTYFNEIGIYALENPISHHGGDIGWRNRDHIVNGKDDHAMNVFVARLTRNDKKFKQSK